MRGRSENTPPVEKKRTYTLLSVLVLKSSCLLLHPGLYKPVRLFQGAKDVLVVIYYILRADYLSHVMERLKARRESWQALEVGRASTACCAL